MKKQDDNAFAMILEHVNDRGSEVPATSVSSDEKDHWSKDHNEGKLAVDVAQDDKHIFVVSTAAGAVPDKIEVFVHNDLLTIRGVRHTPLDNEEDIEYFYKECFWGIFSRTIVLPTDVKGDLAHAKYQNGILTIKIPKRQADAKIEIEIIEE
ncbi:Hsp20/alpha crystallin family protein [Candidatus Parcubacteria bacterium]|jgi:HSP20 family protein|nr:Hsp20/alpha crystallin family protein [Candidatus Parcubacteria bacterium]MBT3949382.1 Hsp20/alpha crystallin family protein [Candidatus Parcubacteria bacterium]